MSNPIFLAALRYLGRGYSVIPVARNKKPLIEWAELQTRRPSPAEIQGWFDKWPDANVGIVTGKISGLTVIDCDSIHGIDQVAQSAGPNWVAPTVETSRGIQFYCKYDERAVNRHTVVEDVDIRSEGGFVVAPPSIHASGKVYSWKQGFGLESLDLPFVPQALLGCSSCAPGGPLPVKREGAVATAFGKGKRHDSILHVLKCAAEGGLEREWVIETGRRLALSCDPPYSERQLKDELAGMVDWVCKKERNPTAEIRSWVLQTTGTFSTTDLYRGLQINDRDSQKVAVVVLARLKEEGVIERHGPKNGVYRKIENDVVKMNWREAQVQPYELRLPLHLNSVCRVFPKSLAVFAGYKDAGKTTFALDIIKRNQDKHTVRYMTNEMSDEELKMRILQHEDLAPDQWNFEAIERTSKYEDVILPNGLNVIDYIEPGISGEFYNIGEVLRRIHEKLEKGVAVIMLQKPKSGVAKNGSRVGELGYGGALSLMRPRLYVTIERGMARIVSAKNWAPGVTSNPADKVMPYHVIGGWKIVPAATEWVTEDALAAVARPGRMF